MLVAAAMSVPAFEVPAFEVPAFEVPAFEVPAFEVAGVSKPANCVVLASGCPVETGIAVPPAIEAIASGVAEALGGAG